MIKKYTIDVKKPSTRQEAETFANAELKEILASLGEKIEENEKHGGNHG
ncbi:MAG: hypothetical protein FWF77_08240 [Defluviitaleaceae bacterium]|nr:hypothetical protein [Defluviitaleaceae bacterium]